MSQTTIVILAIIIVGGIAFLVSEVLTRGLGLGLRLGGSADEQDPRSDDERVEG